jgi:hypothetical protein
MASAVFSLCARNQFLSKRLTAFYWIIKMSQKIGVLLLFAFAACFPAATQDKPVLVVNAFTVDSSVPWPYDMKQLQAQTVVQLKLREGKKFDIVTEAAPATKTVYMLRGEIIEWHPGNRVERSMVGMGSGRESAKIHYWLDNAVGKKIFEHTDTIRASFWDKENVRSAGQLAEPFCDKVSERLSHAKLL